MNEEFKPEIITGAYDDFDVTDDFYWAETELYLLTGDEAFKEAALTHRPKDFIPAVWGNVAELADMELGNSEPILAHLQPYIDEAYSHPEGTHPGFLAGGPNRMRQDTETDGIKYPKNVAADESYLDEQPSYASNEVTINWNVTLFALTAGLDALE